MCGSRPCPRHTANGWYCACSTSRPGAWNCRDWACRTTPSADLRHLLGKPHGILLVTGPTGSGKTTSLYAALSSLNDQTRNILTVEDPIEYHLPGVGQMPVNPKVDMTFARGLRAILRQDPDVVMVGEIRDRETAEIAVQASLTGHLVLSTLHTNSAVGAVTRLVDMGVDAYLLASSLVGILAQRLLRTLCPHCKAPYIADATACQRLGLDAPHRCSCSGPWGVSSVSTVIADVSASTN